VKYNPLALYTAALIVFFALSAFFSMVKIVFASIEQNTPPDDDAHLKHYYGLIEELYKNKLNLATTVSLGKSIANAAFILASLQTILLIWPAMRPVQACAWAFIVSIVILTFGAHNIPRACALRFYQKYIPLIYGLYRVFNWLFLPAVVIVLMFQRGLLGIFKYDEKFSFLSEEEKSKMTESPSENDAALDEEEKEMIHNIFRMGDQTVEEIMVPRINIYGLDCTADFTTTLNTIREEGHSRFPVYKDSIDTIVGILYAKEVLSWISLNKPESWNVMSIIKKPHFVPMSKKIDDLMREFKKEHMHIAVVVDEYGGTAGIVTMEDILEEIVGEIQDEYDLEEKPVIQLTPNHYRVDPHIDIAELNETLNITLDTEDVDYTTLSGLIYHECGTIPTDNMEFDFSGLRIKIVKMDNQRIDKVEITILSGRDAAPDATIAEA
jgi:CBS domain containing-hemolysin-like protein